MSQGSVDIEPRVIAVAGGKGGVGKSLLAANVGIFLATLGKRVVLVDGALGGANLHIFTGLAKVPRTLSEALGRDAGAASRLADVVVPTAVPGLRLIAGSADPAWISTPSAAQTAALIADLRTLDADLVIVDLAAGMASHTLDIFLAADVGLLVAVPEPTAVELLYRFIRAAFIRQLERSNLAQLLMPLVGDIDCAPSGIPSPLDMYLHLCESDPDLAERLAREILAFRPHLVINGARSKADMELGRAIAAATRRRLGLPLTSLGHLEYDEAVWVAVRRRRPLLIEHPESRVSKCMEKVARRLMTGQIGRDSDIGAKQVVAGNSHYELLEVAPTASFEDIRRANRRIREVYGRESVVVGGLFTDEQIDGLHRQFDTAYVTLMDAAKRKAYDLELFPDGVPSRSGERVARHSPPKVEVTPTERPPMPALDHKTVFSGALMKQAREAQGIELREIAERTKIGMAYLQALEAENYKKLPAAVYMRGFLVEYAKMVGLPRSRVVDSYLERHRSASQDPGEE